MAATTNDITSIWTTFGSDTNAIRKNRGTNSSVAQEALLSLGFSISENASVGGSLGNLDIKRMDVKTAVSMSLMETFAKTGVLYELVADNTGGVKFVKIGTGGGSLYPIYYNIQTTSYDDAPTDALVTGGKDLPKVEIGTFLNVLKNKKVYTQQTMFENCRVPDFYKYATITYKDPHLDSTYADGIDNLYDIDNPYKKLIGYVHYKDTGFNTRKDIKISWSSESSVPICVAKAGQGASLEDPPNISVGKLQPIYTYSETGKGEASCFSGVGTTVTTAGLPIVIPPELEYDTVRGVKQSGFIRVSNVYLIGVMMDFLFYAPKNEAALEVKVPTADECVLWASINRLTYTTFKCEEGKHYAIHVDEKTGAISIVFGKSTRKGDPFNYGANTPYRIDPISTFGAKKGGQEFKGTVIPITKSSGMLVFEVWAVLDFEMPSINIYDPQGKADKIADKFVYTVAPITAIDNPAPMANKSGAIDLVPGAVDTDPTTIQSFTDTPLEKVMDSMQGGGVTVTWSFLDTQAEVTKAAANLYDLLTSQNNVETVYTCGPDATPELGSSFGGGYINAIKYSYTDQGSYTISVTAGPMITPSSIVSVDGGPTPMMTENVSAKGTIIQSGGDNINFKVRINGYGERWAVCMTPAVLRVGDVVQCSVHNNPVEY